MFQNYPMQTMIKKIAGFVDGLASFNYEAHILGYDITSYDPIYQFTKEELEKRIEEVRGVELKATNYQFQKNANKMLLIQKTKEVVEAITQK